MNLWRQTKIYTCDKCHAEYLHDKAHGHAVYRCPKRHEPVKSNAVQDVPHAA